jgi:DNA topoisomerase-2
MTSKNNQSKTIEERYQKKTQHEHILLRPDTYMDSIKNDNIKLYIFNEEMQKITFEEKLVNQGLYKIFDEILVNASDQSIRDLTCDTIKINIDKKTGFIEIYNNGSSDDFQIPIQIHKEHKIYIPELIFGHLLSGENFNDDDNNKRIVGGKNGYGAKLTNIYSLHFEIEVVNTKDKKQYNQIFKNNMYEKNDPIIKKSNIKIGYTKIKFLPDYKRFGMDGLTDDMVSLLKKRTYDIAGTTTKNIKIYYNEELIKINNFEDYIKMFYTEMPSALVYQDFNERWSIGVLFDSNSGHKNISYVNRISTYGGGTHVKYLMDQIIEKVSETIKKKNKTLTIKPSTIKDNLTIFINSTIGNPDFDSQSKKILNTKEKTWVDDGFPCVLDEKFIKNICKTGLQDEITRLALNKQEAELGKMNSKKKDNLREILKLNDANFAGTKKSQDCTIIFTEGDSAKALAMSGLSVIGNDLFGVMPLKGKIVNVREILVSKVLSNEEIGHIMKIIGLKHGQVYSDTKKLRYGQVLIFVDADHDGSHIKGLFINLIHKYWPSLLDLDFIQTISTPLVKAYKKSDSKKLNPEVFYTMFEYKQWSEKNKNIIEKYNIKYYKGLGTSDKIEAKEIFKDYDKKLITYVCNQTQKSKKDNKLTKDENKDNSDENSEQDLKSVKSYIKEEDLTETDKSILLAFDKKKADDRKEWLKTYDEDLNIDINNKRVTFSDFVNKELIHFSHSDNIRSIPDMTDGLKPSQRKILFSAFKRKLTTEIKVAQFAGYVSEHSGYHHGEASLHGAIISMAQDYCGSNNINLFTPNGQFGSRRLLGKDHASPRYIFTQLNSLTRLIFREEDEQILLLREEDGDIVEPYNYYPIIPMILVNGTEGIGTGYSTEIPPHNPSEIINNIRLYLDGKKMNDMVPWYNKYTGTIEKGKEKSFNIRGKYTIKDENTLIITEIPISIGIESYKEKLEELVNPKDTKKDKTPIITNWKEEIEKDSEEDTINIVITFENSVLQQLIKNEIIDKTLKLSSSISINNMHLFKNNIITKYDNTNKILEEYVVIRLQKYEERRLNIILVLENEMNMLFYKKKYIEQVLKEEIIIKHRKRNDIIGDLVKLKYPELNHKLNGEKSYDYLTGFLLFALTEESIEKLMKEYNDKKEELEFYKNTTNKDIWLKELDELENAYNKTMGVVKKEKSVKKNVKKVKK